MTVGGRIWHVEDGPKGRLILVNGTGSESRDWLCIRVVNGDEPLKQGDKIWWQGRQAFWTPQPFDGRSDVPITRVGFSFSVPEDMRRLMNERVGSSVS